MPKQDVIVRSLARFTPFSDGVYLEGNLKRDDETKGDGQKQKDESLNWGGYAHIPAHAKHFQWDNGGNLFFRNMWVRQLIADIGDVLKPFDGARGRWHIHTTTALASVDAIRDVLRSSNQYIYLLTHGAARIEYDSDELRNLFVRQRAKFRRLKVKIHPQNQFRQTPISYFIPKDVIGSSYLPDTEKRERKNIEFLLKHTPTEISWEVMKNKDEYFTLDEGEVWTNTRKKHVTQLIERILADDVKREMIEGVVVLGGLGDLLSYEEIIGLGNYGTGNFLIISNCFGRGEQPDTGQISGVQFVAVVDHTVTSNVGLGLEDLVDDLHARTKEAKKDKIQSVLTTP